MGSAATSGANSRNLFFVNDRIGWAISNAGASGTGLVIASTQDGGATWDSSVVLPGEDPREGSIYFTDEGHGALLTGGKFFYSVDGGKRGQVPLAK